MFHSTFHSTFHSIPRSAFCTLPLIASNSARRPKKSPRLKSEHAETTDHSTFEYAMARQSATLSVIMAHLLGLGVRLRNLSVHLTTNFHRSNQNHRFLQSVIRAVALDLNCARLLPKSVALEAPPDVSPFSPPTPMYTPRNLKRLGTEAMEAQSHLIDLNDPQIELHLLRSCLSLCKLNHLLRSTPPGKVDNQLSRFDTGLHHSLELITRSSISPSSCNQATLPIALVVLVYIRPFLLPLLLSLGVVYPLNNYHGT